MQSTSNTSNPLQTAGGAPMADEPTECKIHPMHPTQRHYAGGVPMADVLTEFRVLPIHPIHRHHAGGVPMAVDLTACRLFQHPVHVIMLEKLETASTFASRDEFEALPTDLKGDFVHCMFGSMDDEQTECRVHPLLPIHRYP